MSDTSMVDISQEEMNEAREWHPQWVVELVHGDSSTGSGIVAERQFVTKKWERVEAVVESYLQQVQNPVASDRSEWFVSVTEVVGVKQGFFINQ